MADNIIRCSKFPRGLGGPSGGPMGSKGISRGSPWAMGLVWWFFWWIMRHICLLISDPEYGHKQLNNPLILEQVWLDEKKIWPLSDFCKNYTIGIMLHPLIANVLDCFHSFYLSCLILPESVHTCMFTRAQMSTLCSDCVHANIMTRSPCPFPRKIMAGRLRP